MYTMTFEITDDDRDQAWLLAEELEGAIGPATRLRMLERALAKRRSDLAAHLATQAEALIPGNDYWQGYVDALASAAEQIGRGRL